MEPLYKRDHLIVKELANGSRCVYERNTQLLILEKSDGSVVIGTLENQYETSFQEEKIKKLVEISLLGYTLPSIANSHVAFLEYNIYVKNFFDINENASKTVQSIIKYCAGNDPYSFLDISEYKYDYRKILEDRDKNRIINFAQNKQMFKIANSNKEFPFFNVDSSLYNWVVEDILSIIFDWFEEIGLKYYEYDADSDSMKLDSFSDGDLIHEMCLFFINDGRFFGDIERGVASKNYLVSQNLYEQALQKNKYFDIYVKNLDEFLCKVVNDEIPNDEIAKQMLEISKYSIKYREITKEYYPFEKKLTKLYEKEPK